MHFTLGVVLPARINGMSESREIQRLIDKLMFRYSEEFELKPYLEECDCIVESRSLFRKRDKRYGKVDPSCEICHGTGKIKTTYNEFACFDWYEIGGRWDGALGGTKRESNVLWRNSSRVSDLPNGYCFFAIVTPNGSWHEQWQFMKAKRSEKKERA